MAIFLPIVLSGVQGIAGQIVPKASCYGEDSSLFCVAQFCRSIDILCELLLTSLGWLHSSLIQFKVLLGSSCLANVSKLK